VLSVARSLFGTKNAASKKAASQARREARAQAILQAMSGATAMLPPQHFDRLASLIQTLTTQGDIGVTSSIVSEFPRSIGEAFVTVSPALMGKKRAAAALAEYQNRVRAGLSQMVPDVEWYGRVPEVIAAMRAPVPPAPTPTPYAPGVPVSYPILPPAPAPSPRIAPPPPLIVTVPGEAPPVISPPPEAPAVPPAYLYLGLGALALILLSQRR